MKKKSQSIPISYKIIGKVLCSKCGGNAVGYIRAEPLCKKCFSKESRWKTNSNFQNGK